MALWALRLDQGHVVGGASAGMVGMSPGPKCATRVLIVRIVLLWLRLEWC